MALARDFAVDMLRMLSGLILWGAYFGVVYGFTALACARQFQDVHWLGIGIVVWAVGIATVAALGGILALLLPSLRALRRGSSVNSTPGFLHWMAVAFGGLALISIVWEALPVLLVPVCQ